MNLRFRRQRARESMSLESFLVSIAFGQGSNSPALVMIDKSNAVPNQESESSLEQSEREISNDVNLLLCNCTVQPNILSHLNVPFDESIKCIFGGKSSVVNFERWIYGFDFMCKFVGTITPLTMYFGIVHTHFQFRYLINARNCFVYNNIIWEHGETFRQRRTHTHTEPTIYTQCNV